MAHNTNGSDLQYYHIGDIATVTSFAHDSTQKNYEVTGKLLAFRRTFVGESVQSLSLFIEGAEEIVIPHHVERYFTIQIHRVLR
jgi:hypothetical protein